MLSPRVQQTPRTARSGGAASPFAPVAAGVPSLEDGSGGVPEGWDGVCEWVLGKRAALWDQLFEQAFLQAKPCLSVPQLHGWRLCTALLCGCVW